MPAAILELRLPGGRRGVDRRVYVTSASVSCAAARTLFLDEAPDGWEISAAGCRPTDRTTSPTTASWRADMRVMFVLYLAVIVTGLSSTP